MSKWQSGWLAAVAVAVLAGLVLGLNMGQPAQAEAEKGKAAGAPGRFTVVETEGHNLIVTDNSTNTLYFYTIDKDQKVGAELKLRGSLDLNQVGKAVIHPRKAQVE